MVGIILVSPSGASVKDGARLCLRDQPQRLLNEGRMENLRFLKLVDLLRLMLRTQPRSKK
jgi:hypothetical protein